MTNYLALHGGPKAIPDGLPSAHGGPGVQAIDDREIDESLGLDPSDFEAKITPYTRAVIPVYMQGVPARIDTILAIARQHSIKVVEDTCQCIGGEYKGRPCGSMGDAGAWSLNYFKV